MRNYKRIEDINNTLFYLREFKQAYKEENGVITVGDIRTLIDRIDLIEECIKKQKDIPIRRRKQFKLFGKVERTKHCRLCDTMLEYVNYCPECGQRFCQ